MKFKITEVYNLGIISNMSFINKIANFIRDTKKDKKPVTRSDIDLFLAQGNMFKVLQPFIIEPVITVSRTLRDEDDISHIINMHVNMFVSYYASVFTVLTNVHGLDAHTALTLLSSSGSVKSRDNMTTEDGRTILDMLANNNPIDVAISMIDELEFGTEAKQRITKTGISRVQQKDIGVPIMLHRAFDLSLTITDKNKKKKKTEITIPIIVKANLIYADVKQMSNFIKVDDKEYTFSARWQRMKDGGISMWDLITASDIIEDYKESKKNDSSRLIQLMEKRNHKSIMKMLKERGAIGFNRYYSMIILDKATIPEIEYAINGKLTNGDGHINSDKVADRLMSQTKSMSLAIVDTNWKTTTVKTMSINGSVRLSIDEIKRMGDTSKKTLDNDMLSELLKTTMGGGNKPFV